MVNGFVISNERASRTPSLSPRAKSTNTCSRSAMTARGKSTQATRPTAVPTITTTPRNGTMIQSNRTRARNEYVSNRKPESPELSRVRGTTPEHARRLPGRVRTSVLGPMLPCQAQSPSDDRPAAASRQSSADLLDGRSVRIDPSWALGPWAWGLTQKELARRLGVDSSTIASWERAEHRPSRRLASIIGRVAEADDVKGDPSVHGHGLAAHGSGR